MKLIQVRKKILNVETTNHEGGEAVQTPLQIGVIAVVVNNPFAGRFADANELAEFVKQGRNLANEMVPELVAALGGASNIETYGKGAIVGVNGELEHGALWHVPGGYAMRELLGWKGDREAYKSGKVDDKPTGQPANALSIVPSTKKVGPPGAALDLPLTNINASYVRGQFDAMEVRVPGSPLPDEIVFILAMTTGYRIHARVGGLRAEDISQWNGLR